MCDFRDGIETLPEPPLDGPPRRGDFHIPAQIVQWIDAEARAEATRLAAQAEAEARRLKEQADLESAQNRAAAELKNLSEREKAGNIFRQNPASLRLEELRTLRELALNASARIYIGFDKHSPLHGEDDQQQA